MTISRRALYAAGEPLGDCVTRREAGRLVCGAGDSESSQTSNTTNKDMRVAGAEGSVNVSADGSTVQVVSTDYGAVNGGLQLASQSVSAVVQNSKNVQDFGLSMYTGALKSVNDASAAVASAYKGSSAQVADAYKGVAADLATAFTDSKAPEKNILIVGGAVVVGLAAVMFLAKKG